MTPVAAVETHDVDALESLDDTPIETQQPEQQTLFFEGIKYERNKLSIGGAGDITIEQTLRPGQEVEVTGKGTVVEVKFKEGKGTWVRRHIVYLDEFTATAIEQE